MTIKKFNLAAIIFPLILSALISADAQNKSSSFYSAPTRLLLKGDEIPEDFNNPNFLLREKFYPVGWSKDGKFAFYTEPADEACGCYFANLYIQDMRTDKILWSREYSSDDDEKKPQTLAAYWKQNQKQFSAKLAQYKIVADRKSKLSDSPLAVGNDSIKIDLLSNVELAEDLYSSKGNVVLKLISKQKGSKIVYQKSYNDKNSDGVMNIETSGVLLSPFESRAAIILIETRRGWEGPPHTTSVTLIGANLTGGYR